MLKNRVEKQEARQPKPEPNIKYIAYYGNEQPEREGELIETKGKNPRREFYRLENGEIKEIWIYESGPWGTEEQIERRRLFDNEHSGQD